jgi:DNA-binding transcriptional LysR family regulator
MVMTGQSAPRTWEFQHRGKPLVVKVRAQVEINSFALLAELVSAGHGIARLPDYLAEGSADSRNLRSILDDFAPAAMPWHVVYPSSRNLSPKVRALVEVLERHFSQMRKPRQAGAQRAR